MLFQRNDPSINFTITHRFDIGKLIISFIYRLIKISSIYYTIIIKANKDNNYKRHVNIEKNACFATQ